MLQPREVCVALRWNSERPSGILRQTITTPVGGVEGWVGEDKIKTFVRMGVIMEGPFRVPRDIRVNAPHRKVHLAQTPSRVVAFLPITRNIVETSARSEEHTSELQSRGHLVCRLLLEKKK